MQNHYVSQFIIKKFSNSLNLFDIKTKKVLTDMNSKSIFFINNFYEDSIETKLASDLEGPFSKLLDEKIIDKKEIKLTRSEILLAKRFALLDSIRTLGEDNFVNLMNNFISNANRYIEFNKLLSDGTELKLPSIAMDNRNHRQIYMDTMKMYIDCSSSEEMLLNESVTKETYCWAKVFLDSFLTFWDCSDDQQFILTDCGMTSEYEPSHTVFEGLDLSKFSYLLYKSKKSEKIKQYYYAQLIAKNQIMYENFNIFKLSSSRCLVLANQFFRLYDGKGILVNGNTLVTFDTPDIWPTYFETKSIVNTPCVEYKKKGFWLFDDIFTYTPAILSKIDAIYLNCLFLWQGTRFIGFDNIDKIIDSLYCSILMGTLNQKKLYENIGIEALKVFIDGLINDRYAPILNKFKSQPNYEYIIKYPDFFASQAMNDIRKNKYLLSYLLENKEMVRTMSNFKFMGTPDERIESLKKDLTVLNAK